MTSNSKIMDKETVRRALMRIAHEILEKNKGKEDLCLVGIRTRGAILAERIQKYIKQIEGCDVPLGILDITLYRDDLTLVDTQPILRETLIDFDLAGKKIVLIDDVLFTGRSMRAAIEVVMSYGRPVTIKAAVLIDRGHRELPIQPNFVGQIIDSTVDEKVSVTIAEKKSRTDKVMVISEVEPEEDAE